MTSKLNVLTVTAQQSINLAAQRQVHALYSQTTHKVKEADTVNNVNSYRHLNCTRHVRQWTTPTQSPADLAGRPRMTSRDFKVKLNPTLLSNFVTMLCSLAPSTTTSQTSVPVHSRKLL